ncbi:hypothetical protein MARI_18740 [Marinobacter sp. JH2]|uniref:tetratricopeptide repeat protein n=1 Tax=Marinobacter sp. AL4B TaxID=2871173 RepID=UPI001056CED9|nr:MULTISPECIES: hypothetical protein [unclassified Marinobacter]MBZ0334192.1 hypothetical protein [Marinobacter sp. AL4B]QBM17753.1 hypothetical protein MARI_18740 [Marinobacter sp. JH2]
MKYKQASLVSTAFFTAALVTGCALPPLQDSETEKESRSSGSYLQVNCSTNMTPEHRVELDAIDSMMNASENYAALARLEALSFQTQHHWLRWAQLLAKVEQLDYSEEVYQQIAETCDSAQAYHGLGIVYVKGGKIEEGLKALGTAKAKEPASADMRNDFGVVLMQGGFFGQAAFELRTAYELSGKKESMGRNMVAAYYLQGGEEAIAKLQRELGLSNGVVSAGIKFSERFAGGV